MSDNMVSQIRSKIKLVEYDLARLDSTIKVAGLKFAEAENEGINTEPYWTAMYLSQVYAVGLEQELAGLKQKLKSLLYSVGETDD